MKRVVVTGGGGQIAYSLLFRIAQGELFGAEETISLGILELPASLEVLKGVHMELNDCAFPLLKEVRVGTDPMEIFEGVDVAFLVGAKPRGKGMERKDLLGENGKVFVGQGKALSKGAAKDAVILVVGNPCNTNCLICMHHAPNIDRKRFFAMTRLDQNRAIFQLAKKSGRRVGAVSNMTIWGNHSSTQVPDFVNAKIDGESVREVIAEESWLQKDFFEIIQQRGAAIIKARGKSSAASAANAALDSLRSILDTTPPGTWFSAGVYSKGNPYNIDEELIFSFPLRSSGKGKYEIVRNLPFDDFIAEKIKLTEKELKEERDLVRDLL